MAPREKGGEPRTTKDQGPRKVVEYDVQITPRLARRIEALPEAVQEKFDLLRQDMKVRGPLRAEMPHYAPLKNDYYHCHLDHSKRWVVVWTWKKKSLVIRIEYVGSHEDAPY